MSDHPDQPDLRCRAWWASSPLPGAIGVLHLQGEVEKTLGRLKVTIPAVSKTTLVEVAGIDEAVIARTGVDSCLLMPHGGPRIRQLLSRALEQIGVELRLADSIPLADAWPEATDSIEAALLEALAITESPRAIPLLLAQPKRHRAAVRPAASEDFERIRALQRLLSPPLIGIAGSPNVGKSTLLNTLAGQEVAIAADQAGTTRDAVVSRVLLDGVACEVVDLPGRRTSDDAIEQSAIRLSDQFIESADLLILVVEDPAARAPALGRTPDLVVLNKIDRLDDLKAWEGPRVSALTGEGIAPLASLIREWLIPSRYLDSEEPWIFHNPPE
ncbi:MAG: hypothetical protein CBC35_04440 [Planctomycetes bacterium TMED75]|nr:hypothetical protein [Planctomycetaceae bacterium]OUU94222.1 MAG: hypothetical protein CBC35_04440 [Planctomycetes bacterium TMED75]